MAVAQFPRGTQCRLLIDQAHYEGRSDDRVIAPAPLGRIGRKIVQPRSWESAEVAPAATRPIGEYAKLIG